jgi:NTP pyrophosphatase (non-canonical NTP hydrolase)
MNRRSTNTARSGAERPRSIEEYARLIQKLATHKGWSKDWRWLATGFFAESGELVNTIVHDGSEAEIAEEFADVMHYLLQLMKEKCPDYDLDRALMRKISSNYKHLKKTTDPNGIVVRK